MDSINEIQNRQSYLPLDVPMSALIVGVGGIGSWVALDLALIGVKKLHLVDFDSVELSNLNRTPFKLSQVGQLKVDALSQLIYERRTEIEINPIDYKIEQLPKNLLALIKDVEVVVDCRDNMKPELSKKLPKSRIICGYDGFNVTIHQYPKSSSVISTDDEPTRYSITPSFVVPPQFLASLICLHLTNGCFKSEEIEKIYSFDMRDIFSMIELGVKSGVEEKNKSYVRR